MSIFRAIGFGILIITLRILIPDVLDEGRQTAIAFLHGARISADTASSITASAASASHSPSSFPNLVYPQAPSIPSY